MNRKKKKNFFFPKKNLILFTSHLYYNINQIKMLIFIFS